MVFIPHLPITPLINLQVSACAADCRRAISWGQKDSRDVTWQRIQWFGWFRLKFSSSKNILYHPVNNFFLNFYLRGARSPLLPPDRGCAAASLVRQSKTNSSLLDRQWHWQLGDRTAVLGPESDVWWLILWQKLKSLGQRYVWHVDWLLAGRAECS